MYSSAFKNSRGKGLNGTIELWEERVPSSPFLPVFQTEKTRPPLAALRPSGEKSHAPPLELKAAGGVQLEKWWRGKEFNTHAPCCGPHPDLHLHNCFVGQK